MTEAELAGALRPPPPSPSGEQLGHFDDGALRASSFPQGVECPPLPLSLITHSSSSLSPIFSLLYFSLTPVPPPPPLPL